LGAVVDSIGGPVDVQWKDETFPIYARAAGFRSHTYRGGLFAGNSAIDYRQTSGGATLHRIGYDLFAEVAYLLTHGQPNRYAPIPALEFHIELIRQSLKDSVVSFVEIPPSPHGHPYTCCLTHDIDFYGIRRHTADRTVLGFAARGTVGTLLDVFRGRRPLDEAIRNWLAVLSLPLTLLGLKRDVWQPFDDYARADGNRGSTFFLVPFSRHGGVGPHGATTARRAVAYGIGGIQADIRANAGPRTEFAVHGLDGWRDSDAGASELSELHAVTGQEKAGVRTHWLYDSDESPAHLERAGFAYDSTWGYNDAIGYRAGTGQVFRLPATEGLLELPLTIMDTAMFYRDRMGLNRDQAAERCRDIQRRAQRFGGTLVINWHDRSLAPERQWGRSYQRLLNDVETDKPWFATASEAVNWFRWRRSIRFCAGNAANGVRVVSSIKAPELPAARLVIHRAGRADAEGMPFGGEARTLTL
jgi:hypothetical protein